MTYNGKMFYYVKNLQGDIVKILDEDGQEKADYVYNAWGDIISQSDDELASIYPLRYRGYVYDEDTATCYLQSRYYDPTTGRFINADDTAFISSSGTVLSCNIFVYCENNPINLYYYTGNCSYLDGGIIKTCHKSNKYKRDNAIKYAEKWSDDYNMQFPKFQKGDLLYFDGNGDGIYTHTSIISSIIKVKGKKIICYAAHTVNNFNKKLLSNKDKKNPKK